MKFRILPGLLALAFPLAAVAADNPELAQIRVQIAEMKTAYEQRIAALEARLAQAESSAATAATTASRAEQQVQQHARPRSEPLAPASAAAFNPEVSLILDGKYSNLSRDPASYRLGGFIPSGGEVAPPNRSFGLGESELAISANIDHLFRGNARFSLAPDNSIATEEAHIETLGLDHGLKLKAGRFLSGIGYLNQRHPHEWDFADAPLAYQAFFGSRLGNDGVQLKWLAPTSQFVELGLELGRGDSFPGNDRNKNGNGLSSLFAHVGGDIGISTAWQAGLSYVRTQPAGRSANDPVDNYDYRFSGDSRTWLADFVLKWAPNGNPAEQNFKLQGEYFRRSENGRLSVDDVGNAVALASDEDFRSRQSGWYAQGVWQFTRGWRVGYRHDRLDSGRIDNATVAAGTLPLLSAHAARGDALMLDWSPSEFSRVRLQFGRNDARGPGLHDNQLFLQYIMSLGAHGAHKF
ncbi:MAG: hypothetical protein RIR00_1321 [Pseudomonadota bacterium]|jgi:hypothetical protein